jgi:hypothetical protein
MNKIHPVDMFAMAAMPALINKTASPEEVARASYQYAKAMLKESNRIKDASLREMFPHRYENNNNER